MEGAEKTYTISGRFIRGCLNGEGTRTYISGKTLRGNWVDNELVTGKLYNTDGTTYEGEWLGGRPHGIGVKTITGKRYEGMFYLGRPWGKGTKIDSDEKKIEGFWDGSTFKKGNPTAAQEADFLDQLKQAKLFYENHKKHNLQELPKTNYDLIREETHSLKTTERALLTKIGEKFSALIVQAEQLPIEFSLDKPPLIDTGKL